MGKNKMLKYEVSNFIFPQASKRRLIIQYIYRMIKQSDNRKDLRKFIKQEGCIKGFKHSIYKLVVPTSREYQEEKYKKFIEKTTLTIEEKEAQRNEKFEFEPLISVITPLYNTKKEFFIDYIASIKNQTYSNFEVCLVDASENELEFVKEIIKDDERIKYKKLERELWNCR